MTLVERIVTLHRALERAGIPHAFGGALALAWCTERARGTIDIDCNLFVPPADTDRVLAAMPAGVTWTADDGEALRRDGQARLWWDGTPVDVFLDTTTFHLDAAGRVRAEQFGGASVPFLGCSDLAVFKAFFDRTKDWADLEAMVARGSLDVDRTLGVLVRLLGPDDGRVARLAAIATADGSPG